MALTCRDGWFECVDNEWEPIIPEATPVHVQVLNFQSQHAEVHERTVRGKDSSSEQRTVGPFTFRGWCHVENGHSLVRMMLPPVLQTRAEGEISVAEDALEVDRTLAADESDIILGSEGGYRGDPDVVVVEAKLR